MAIVVNNPGESTGTSGSNGSDVAMSIVALAIVIVLVAGAIYLIPRLANRSTQPAAPGANINVTLPAGSTNNSGATGGAPANNIAQ